MVALISWGLLGTMEMCMPRGLQMTPKTMASAKIGTLLLCQMLPFQILPVPHLPLPVGDT